MGDADLGEREEEILEGGQRHHLWSGRTTSPCGELGAGETGGERGSGEEPWGRGRTGKLHQADPKRAFQDGEEQAGSGSPMVSNIRSLQLFGSCLLLPGLKREPAGHGSGGTWHNKWNLVEIKA